jgi:Protein of unknown function (DUF993)
VEQRASRRSLARRTKAAHAELFHLADKARVLHDPDRAASRRSKLLALHGLA